jgi:hypothetical protein
LEIDFTIKNEPAPQLQMAQREDAGVSAAQSENGGAARNMLLIAFFAVAALIVISALVVRRTKMNRRSAT